MHIRTLLRTTVSMLSLAAVATFTTALYANETDALHQRPNKGTTATHFTSASSAHPAPYDDTQAGARHKGWHYVFTPAITEGTDGAFVTFEQAMALALEKTGGGTVVKSEGKQKKHGRMVYEFKILNAGMKYEVEIDSTGALLEFEQETGTRYFHTPQTPDAAQTAPVHPTQSPATSAPQANPDFVAIQTKALEAVGGGTISEYKLDTDNGRNVHRFIILGTGKRTEIELRDDGTVLMLKSENAE